MRKLTGIILVTFTIFSFTTLKREKKAIDLTESKIEWLGKKNANKKRVSTHVGTLNFSSGHLVFEGEKMVGGSFIVDMTSLVVTDHDLHETLKKILEKHLKSDDFFAVDEFTTSELVFTKVKRLKGKYQVTADLTIKGNTNSVNFDMFINGNSAITNFNLDRTKYDIKFGSKVLFDKVKNKVLEDEFEVSVKLQF
ncbi:YceI family protein [Bacteroidota bacterium]